MFGEDRRGAWAPGLTRPAYPTFLFRPPLPPHLLFSPPAHTAFNIRPVLDNGGPRVPCRNEKHGPCVERGAPARRMVSRCPFRAIVANQSKRGGAGFLQLRGSEVCTSVAFVNALHEPSSKISSESWRRLKQRVNGPRSFLGEHALMTGLWWVVSVGECGCCGWGHLSSISLLSSVQLVVFSLFYRQPRTDNWRPA